MSITFACGQCGKSYDVDSAHAGKRVKCKACGVALTVPAASAPKANAAPPKKRPAAPVEDDDRFGLAEAAEASRREPTEALIPRGRGGQRSGAGQTSGGGTPGWLWPALGAGVCLVVALLIAGVVVATRSGSRKATDVAHHDAASEAVAPIGSDATETASTPAKPDADAAGFQRDDTSTATSLKTWRVKPDPSAEPLEFPEIAKLAIPVPDYYGGDGIMYPTTPSPFVLLGGNDNDKQFREVWDLRKPARVGRLQGKIDVHNPKAFSPDGQYFVTHTLFEPKNWDIWRTNDSTRIARIADDGKHLYEVVDFAGPDRIVMGSNLSKFFQVWDFVKGKTLAKVSLPDNFDTESVAFSPGRRYLTLQIRNTNKLQVYDLNNGWLVGEIEMEKPGNSDFDCEGMAFSPDGALLAGVFEAGGKTYLKVWDATSGKLVSDFSADGHDAYGKKQAGDDRLVQWLPDLSGLFIANQTIVERQSGQIVWTLPYPPINYKVHGPRRILDLGRVITTAEVNGRRALQLVPLPRDKIQTALALAKGGGNAVEATLPPITTADLASAKKVAAVAGPVAWSPVAGTAAAAKSPASGKSIALKTAAGDILALLVSGPDATQVIAVSAPGGRLGDTKGKQTLLPRTAERFDLATGRPLGKFEIPSVSLPIAFDPGATHILLAHTGAPDRLDVQAVDKGAHVAGWRPYDKETGDDRNVVWADFLDAKRVLTVNPAGTLILWTVPDCKAVYVAEAAMQGAFVLSPDRKLMAAHRNEALRLIDPETGTPRGDAPTTGHKGALGLQAAAFAPDGKELAAVLDEAVVHWDLKTGQVVGEFPSPSPKALSLQFGAARHALIDGKVLVDLDRKRAVWYYSGGVHPRGGSGASHRYIASASIIGAGTLGTLEIPDKKIARAEALAADPKARALLREGGKIGIRIVGAPPRDADKFRQELVTALTDRFRAVGIDVADDQPVRLVVTFKESDTGQTMELRKHVPGSKEPEKRLMPIRKIELEISVSDDKGAAIVIAKEDPGARRPGLISFLPAGENDWEGFLRTQQWFGASSEVAQRVLPFFVARGSEGGVFLPGATFLGHPSF